MKAQDQKQGATFHYMTILYLLNTESCTCIIHLKRNNHLKFFKDFIYLEREQVRACEAGKKEQRERE